MDASGQVSDILADAERKIGALVADALGRRDYATVQWLSAVAERVAAAGAVNGAMKALPPPAGSAVVVGPGEGRPADGLGKRDAAPAGGARAAPAKYPQFRRADDQLVKVGFSKSDRRTYEHRSPRDVLERVAAAVGRAGTGGRRFTTDQLTPDADPKLADVPTYQVYLCLAFLVRHGLVRRHGRSGYTVAADSGSKLSAAVAAAWQALPAN